MNTIVPPKGWALGGHCHPPSPAGLQRARKAKEINGPRYFSSQTESHRGCTQTAANHGGGQQPPPLTPPAQVPRSPGVAGHGARGTPGARSPRCLQRGAEGTGTVRQRGRGWWWWGVSAPEEGESLRGAGGSTLGRDAG